MEENRVKNPFPKIRLNKSNRSKLKQAVQNYLENKYPRISTETVTREMECFLNSLVSRQDAQVLKKFGSLHKKVRPYCVCVENQKMKRAIIFSTSFGLARFRDLAIYIYTHGSFPATLSLPRGASLKQAAITLH